ncbi:fatty acid desaturase family protein [Zooshikella harenae]|uniref:Fatty acid desaturase n=1 Tax=Zooshikella harenae TaxID=2827238 RepID=A0ABS5Z6W9_9GAMM|nr:fatty acid desaturase [Zooshikella harenae]MBU2709793.1 fatty acid desaturase [Zooshikella harenae]
MNNQKKILHQPEKTNEFNSTSPIHSAGIRVDKELLNATIPFAQESRRKSWRLVTTIFALLFMSLIAAGFSPWPWLQLVFSLLSSMFMVRAFITFHDYMHGAILRDSQVASWFFWLYGLLILVPTRSWRESHNYHHGHVGKLDVFGTGTFPIMTTKMWLSMSKWQRFYYRLQRHPLTILFGYLTIFAISICLLPFLKNPSKHLDSLLSIILHSTLIWSLWYFAGANIAFFVVLLPMSINCAFGSYLFFAQHSFKRMVIITPEAWTYYRAALESSSYMHLNKVMQWFTGNIGYHHIHHLNVRIPFYRLPEVMAAIPELQSPIVTTLALGEIYDCFKSSLWDEDQQRMVSYREATNLYK